MQNSESIIAQSTGDALLSLAEYGLLGCLAAVGLGFLLWTAYQCSRHSKEALDNNTKALHGIEIALVKIETKLDK